MAVKLLWSCVLLLTLVPALFAGPDGWRPGDLVYLRIPTSFGRAIEDVTHAPVSHVGVLARHASGHLTVVHALMKVQEEPVERYLERGRGKYAVARYPFPSEGERDRFVAAARALVGRGYDYQFVMDNSEIYCSELVYRAFSDGLGIVPVALHPLDFGAPGTESRRIMERVTHGPIPDGTPGVSPGDYFRSDRFRTLEDRLAE